MVVRELCKERDNEKGATQRHQCDWDHVTVRLSIKQWDSRSSLKHDYQCVTAVPPLIIRRERAPSGRAINFSSFPNLSPDVPRVARFDMSPRHPRHFVIAFRENL
jgi:hypothetical protein